MPDGSSDDIEKIFNKQKNKADRHGQQQTAQNNVKNRYQLLDYIIIRK